MVNHCEFQFTGRERRLCKGVDKGGLWGLSPLPPAFYEIIKRIDSSSLKLNLQFKFRITSQNYNFIRVTRKRHYRCKLLKVS